MMMPTCRTLGSWAIDAYSDAKRPCPSSSSSSSSSSPLPPPAKARVLLGAATELLLRGHGTTGCPVDDDDDDDDDADDDDDVQAASVFGFAHIIYCIRQLLQNSVPQPQTDSATRFRRVS